MAKVTTIFHYKPGLVGILLAYLIASVACTAEDSPSPPSFTPTFPFTDGFEGAASFLDLFPEDASRWHSYQLQPEQNSAELTSENVHSGASSLRLYAVPYDGHNASKADLQLTGLRFAKGDHVWFSAWYYLDEVPDSKWLFLWDLEETQRQSSPGRRLYLDDGEALVSDLGKWWNEEVFRQPVDSRIPFPKGRWVELVVHLYLTEGKDGVMEVWQDATLVLSANGQTLPTADSTYDRLQVGITANGNESHAQVLYIDDVTLSTEPLR